MSRLTITYWSMAWLARTVLTVCRVRWKVLGADLVPRTGPCIVVANHLSFVDPTVIVASAPRRLSFMAKEELAQHPGSSFILWAMGAVTVRRGRADRAALRNALRTLRQGQALAIFPEGTRSRTGQLQPGFPGAALLAQWSGASIVPAAIWGTEGVQLPRSFFDRPEVTVRFGAPFTLFTDQDAKAGRPALADATDTIMHHIAALLPEQHRGVYATAASVGSAPVLSDLEGTPSPRSG